MQIRISHRNSGWTPYVMRENDKDHNQEEIKVLMGNPKLTEKIYNDTKEQWKNNYCAITLSFKEKGLDEELLRNVLGDFREKFMEGFEQNEYDFSAVLHKDTNHDHIHICIPNLNLESGLKNDYYFHKRDLKRVESLQDYLNVKYNLETTPENNNNKHKLDHINTHRLNNNSKPLDINKFKTLKNKDKEELLNSKIVEFIGSGIITDFKSLKGFFESVGLLVYKVGRDYTTDKDTNTQHTNFHYFTLKDQDGKKLRLIGDIYNERLWEQSGREHIKNNIRNYIGNKHYKNPHDTGIEKLTDKLNKYNTKHTSRINNRKGKSKNTDTTTNNTRTQDKSKNLDNNYFRNNNSYKFVNNGNNDTYKNRVGQHNSNHNQQTQISGTKSNENNTQQGKTSLSNLINNKSGGGSKGFSGFSGGRQPPRFPGVGASREELEAYYEAYQQYLNAVAEEINKSLGNFNDTNLTNNGGNNYDTNTRNRNPEYFETSGREYEKINRTTTTRNFNNTPKDNINSFLQQSQSLNRQIQSTSKQLSKINERIGNGGTNIMSEVENLKSNVSLVDFAEVCGFDIKKSKSTKNSIQMTNGSDKIFIKVNYNGHYMWYDINNPGSINGSIVDFYKKFVDDKKPFGKIIGELRKFSKGNGIKTQLIQQTPQEKNLSDCLNSYGDNKLHIVTDQNDTLRNKRKFNEKTLKTFTNCFIDNRNNICFPQYKYEFVNGKFRYNCINIEIKNEQTGFKGHEEGEKGLWGQKVGNSKKIFVFESAIKAMGYYQLTQQDGYYISIGGNISEPQQKSLIDLIDHIQPEKTFICMDNDESGDKIGFKIIETIKQTKEQSFFEVQRPKLKDWNDDLEEKMKTLNDKVGNQHLNYDDDLDYSNNTIKPKPKK